MRSFNLGNLDSWEPVPVGQLFALPGEGGPRSVRFVVMAAGPVAIFVTDDAAARRLVATGEGLLRVSFTAQGVCDAELVGEAGTEVFVQLRSEPQVIAESDLPSFATIEPRGVGPSSELRRMMMMVRLNQERREAILKDEIARLGGAYDAERRKRIAARKAAAEAAGPPVDAQVAGAGGADPA